MTHMTFYGKVSLILAGLIIVLGGLMVAGNWKTGAFLFLCAALCLIAALRKGRRQN
jgi:hypothetical protein